MKNLLKITLLLLLGMFTFSSCTEKLETPPVKSQIIADSQTPVEKIGGLIGNFTIFTPKDLDQEERSAYISSLTEGELVASINTVKVFNFLGATGNLEKLIDENPNFENLTIEDVFKYAPREAHNFYNHEKEGLRGCSYTGEEECIGNTLYVYKKCCFAWIICWTESDVTINAEECGGIPPNPCNCNSNQYCSGGVCIDIPTCSPPCPIGQICTGYYCIYM